MARRGDKLREHILLAAKDVFLEVGFERASMDVVAARASTSKRSVYAHFESKDKLFLAVIDLVRELYLGKLKTPDAYSEHRVEAVVLFCGRFLQLLLWEPALRTCRLGICEAGRLSQASGQYYAAIFDATHERLAEFLCRRFGLTSRIASDRAHDLLGRTVYPRLFRALFGVEEPIRVPPDESAIATDIDLTAIRAEASAILSPGTPA